MTNIPEHLYRPPRFYQEEYCPKEPPRHFCRNSPSRNTVHDVLLQLGREVTKTLNDEKKYIDFTDLPNSECMY